MKHKVHTKIIALLFIAGSLFLSSSCEPPLCAWCYENGSLPVGREVEICAENQYDLDELVWLTEDMGYYCEYQ